MPAFEPGVEIELNQKLKDKVMSFRTQSYSWFKRHYYELIINQRNYLNLPTGINKYKMEHFLRYGYDVVVGYNALGNVQLLGWVNNRYNESDPTTLYGSYREVKKGDINFIVPNELIPDDMTELTQSHPHEGNFIVVRNKVVPFVSDFETINIYATQFAELAASYFSLIIQSKVTTIIQGNVGDETLNQEIEELYNGSPYLKLSSLVNPERQFYDFRNTEAASQFKVIQDAKEVLMNELNNAIGINSTGVMKESGVSNAEVNSNNDKVNQTGNIWLNGIQEPFNLWNALYKTNWLVYLDNVPTQQVVNNENDNNN